MAAQARSRCRRTSAIDVQPRVGVLRVSAQQAQDSGSAVTDVDGAQISAADVDGAPVRAPDVGDAAVAGTTEETVGDSAVETTGAEEVVGHAGVAEASVEINCQLCATGTAKLPDMRYHAQCARPTCKAPCGVGVGPSLAPWPLRQQSSATTCGRPVTVARCCPTTALCDVSMAGPFTHPCATAGANCRPRTSSPGASKVCVG